MKYHILLVVLVSLLLVGCKAPAGGTQVDTKPKAVDITEDKAKIDSINIDTKENIGTFVSITGTCLIGENDIGVNYQIAPDASDYTRLIMFEPSDDFDAKNGDTITVEGYVFDDPVWGAILKDVKVVR